MFVAKLPTDFHVLSERWSTYAASISESLFPTG